MNSDDKSLNSAATMWPDGGAGRPAEPGGAGRFGEPGGASRPGEPGGARRLGEPYDAPSFDSGPTLRGRVTPQPERLRPATRFWGATTPSSPSWARAAWASSTNAWTR